MEGMFDFSKIDVADNHANNSLPSELPSPTTLNRDQCREWLLHKYVDWFIEKLQKGVPPVGWPDAEMKIYLELGEFIICTAYFL